MNTIRSTGYGWGVLIFAGAGAYYFAKKSINEDKAERQEKELKRRMLLQRMEARERVELRTASGENFTSAGRAPAHNEVISASAAKGLNTPTEPVQRSKYAPSEPFISKKGDRFS